MLSAEIVEKLDNIPEILQHGDHVGIFQTSISRTDINQNLTILDQTALLCVSNRLVLSIEVNIREGQSASLTVHEAAATVTLHHGL
jgi:hypothetical protein